MAGSVCFATGSRGQGHKNRLHIDPDPDDLEAEVARLLALGARPADVGQGDAPWVVFADPQGNKFCCSRTSR